MVASGSTPKPGKSSRLVPPPIVVGIEVDGLFGEYNYTLGPPEGSGGGSRRLFLIYGDNGAGKTTILRLLFNLMSSAPTGGHRTYLARARFRRFAVHLSDGSTVTAIRPADQITGSYGIVITRGSEVILDLAIEMDKDGGVTSPQDPTLQAYLDFLQGIDLNFFYLSDDRKLRSNIADESEDPFTIRAGIDVNRLLTARAVHHQMMLPLEGDGTIVSAVERFEGWVRDQAILASNIGEASTNTIYADIIRRIAKPGRTKRSNRTIEEVETALQELQARAERFSSLGLISPLSFLPIKDAIGAARGPAREIVVGVVGPYVDSIEARLNALEKLQGLLMTFVESVSSFLFDKDATFELGSGLRISSTRSGAPLDLRVLSSGERQLLLLFCNTVLAREQSSVVIIDEPEISLNVKWQRRLLQSLLALTEDSDVQFIIATHSLELLSRYRDAVRKLEDRRTQVRND